MRCGGGLACARAIVAASEQGEGKGPGRMPLGASKRRASKALAALGGLSLTSALGLAFLQLADWALFTGGMAVPDMGVKFVSRMAQVLALAFALVIDRRVPYDEQALERLTLASGAAVSASALVMALAYEQAQPVALVAGAFYGAGKTALLLGWGYYLCSVEPRASSFELILGFALSSLASWALASLPRGAIVAAAGLSPLLSAACYPAALARAGGSAVADEPVTRERLRVVPWPLFALMAACTLTSLYVHALVPTAELERDSSYQALVSAVFLALLAVFFVWAVPLKRTDPTRLWPLLVITIVAGLVCYTSFVQTDPGLAMAALTSTQMCMMPFVWIVTADVAHVYRLPKVFTFGLATLLLVEPITIVITLRSLLAPEGFAGEGMAVGVVVGLALLLMALTVVITGLSGARPVQALVGADGPGGSAREGGTGPGGAVDVAKQSLQDPLSAAVDSVADDYGLTGRERQVAEYLARGYTFPQAAESLGVSLDTVRSHVKSVYRKLDVHKKQDMIRIVEEREPELR